MKKIISTICGLGCVFAIFLGCAENPDGSCNIGWTGGCIAAALVLGWIWNKLNPSKNNTL